MVVFQSGDFTFGYKDSFEHRDPFATWPTLGSIGSGKRSIANSADEMSAVASSLTNSENRPLTGRNVMRRLRKSVITRFTPDVIERLKMYVAVPVLKKIEEGQPLAGRQTV